MSCVKLHPPRIYRMYAYMQGPFRYKALQPTDISFVPLTESGDKSYNGSELLNFYREDPTVKHLKVLPL